MPDSTPTLPPAAAPAAAGSAAAGQSSAVAPPSPPATPDITSSNILMGPQKTPFIDWFNDTFRKKGLKFQADSSQAGTKAGEPMFANRIRPNFNVIWDNIPLVLGAGRTSATFSEFITLSMIPYNETGGSYFPIREAFYVATKECKPLFDDNGQAGTPISPYDPGYFRQDKYLFEAKWGTSGSYNVKPQNRRAGDQMSQPGLLWGNPIITDPGVIARWNGQNYPYESANELKEAARECDFFKFSGLGLIQLTWRGTYLVCADPWVRAYNKKNGNTSSSGDGLGVDAILRSQLEAAFRDPTVYLPSVLSFNQMDGKSGPYQQACTGTASGFAAYGKAVAGTTDYGTNVYAARCLALQAAMKAVGYSVAAPSVTPTALPSTPPPASTPTPASSPNPPSTPAPSNSGDAGAGDATGSGGTNSPSDGGLPPGGTTAPAPATADALTQALATVKASFTDSSWILSDIALTSSDDTTAQVNIVVNDGSALYGKDGLVVIVNAIWDALEGQNISQGVSISYSLLSDAGSVYQISDCIVHDSTVFSGAPCGDQS